MSHLFNTQRAMGAEMCEEKIKAAVVQCLDHCYATGSWYGCWSQFMESLFHDRTWTIAEVEKVQLVMCNLLMQAGGGPSQLASHRPSRAQVDQAIRQALVREQ
ncbi:hypothetical protein NA78x_006252 [Anatilimnocola sp. NA78]|uniref:hypothetical protein n=1 Tax=Anatilimnocola sp. NA78 TaxID=3415683 RepID=UPI003CE4D14D